VARGQDTPRSVAGAARIAPVVLNGLASTRGYWPARFLILRRAMYEMSHRLPQQHGDPPRAPSGPQPMRQPPPVRPASPTLAEGSTSPEVEAARLQVLSGYGPENENQPTESAEEAGRRIAAQVPKEEPPPQQKSFWGRVKDWWSGDPAPAAQPEKAAPSFAESFDAQSYEGSCDAKREKMAGFRQAILSGDPAAKAEIVDRMQDDSDAPGELKEACEQTLDGDTGKLARMREFLQSDAGKELTDDELVALFGYTGGDYRKLNAALRGDLSPEDAAKLGPYAEKVKSGLEKLPPHEGVAYRGMAMSPERLEEYLEKSESQEPIADKGFSSASTSEEAALHSLKKNDAEGKVKVMVEVRSSKGRDVTALSQNPHEQEVLFAPGSKFKIVDKQQLPDGSWKFVVEDAPGEDEVRRQPAAA
jgi:hypothetical protein